MHGDSEYQVVLVNLAILPEVAVRVLLQVKLIERCRLADGRGLN